MSTTSLVTATSAARPTRGKVQTFADEDPKQRALGNLRLRLGDKIQIPVDVAVRKLAWIGKSGSGKSWGVGLLLEQMRLNGVRFLVIDPVGTHTGLAQMEGVHYHEVQKGMHVGKFVLYVLENDLNVIINLRSLTFEEQRIFLSLFAGYLYRFNKEYGPRHLVIEEVQQFAPQQGKSESKEILQVLSTMGRMEGIGLSVVTQRPAIVDKTVIANTDAFVFYQLMLPQDLGAVTEVLTARTSMPKEEEQKIEAIIASMPSLGKGEIILYSPEWLQVAERAQVNAKRITPHTGATPDDYVRPLGDEPQLAHAAAAGSLATTTPPPPAPLAPPRPPLETATVPTVQAPSNIAPLPRAPIPHAAMLQPPASSAGSPWRAAAACFVGFALFPAIFLPLHFAFGARVVPVAPGTPSAVPRAT